MAAALAVGCNRSTKLEAPPPAVAPDTETPAGLPPSTLNVPISYDLTPIIEKLEQVVPRRFGDLDDREKLPSNNRVSYAFEAERDPFHVELEGNTAHLSSVIRYRGRGWYDPPIGPTVSASCGTGENDAPRRVAVALSADIDLTREWTLQSRSRVDRIAPVSRDARDRCRITVVRVDITERLVGAARDLLQKNTRNIDAAIAGLDVHSQFQEWWDVLQSPIELTDSVWLLLNPIAVRKGAAGGRGLLMRVGVGLSAAPRIVIGERPVVVPVPLPPLDTGNVGQGLHILVEGIVDYDVASEVLTEQLRGRVLAGAGQQIRIRGVELSGIGAGKLALRVEFDGSVRGSMYLVGTPRFDPETHQVHVPDLDFDVASEDLRVRGLAWLGKERALAFLRERARFPIGDPIQLGQRYLVEGLNRNLSDDVRLSGEVISIVPLDVHATRRVLLLRAHAQATARLIVRERPEVTPPVVPPADSASTPVAPATTPPARLQPGAVPASR